MKILNITSTPQGIGGAERLLLDMSDKFDPRRFSLSYCNFLDTKNGNGEFPTALRDKNFEVFNIKGQSSRQSPQIFYNLVKLLKREKFDIVHTHLLPPTIIGTFAARFAGNSKTIVTRHYTDDALTNPQFVRRLEHRALKTADKITAVSKAVENDILKAGIEKDKIELIYNGMDLEKFDRQIVEAGTVDLNIKNDDYLIGNIANLWVRKGQVDLIRAFPKILARFPQTKLVFVGEGTEKDNLRKLAADLNVADKIIFAGFQRNIIPLLKRFDLYVHPSHQEPFGIALLEAMAAKKCVIATAVGGIPEVVAAEKTGWLVPPKNPEKLAETIIKSIVETDLTGKMGEAGRQRVEKTFSLDTIVEKYEELYTRIIND